MKKAAAGQRHQACELCTLVFICIDLKNELIDVRIASVYRILDRAHTLFGLRGALLIEVGTILAKYPQ